MPDKILGFKYHWEELQTGARGESVKRALYGLSPLQMYKLVNEWNAQGFRDSIIASPHRWVYWVEADYADIGATE